MNAFPVDLKVHSKKSVGFDTYTALWTVELSLIQYYVVAVKGVPYG